MRLFLPLFLSFPLSLSLSLSFSLPFVLHYSTRVFCCFSLWRKCIAATTNLLLLHRLDARRSCLIRSLNFPLMYCRAVNDGQNFRNVNPNFWPLKIFSLFCHFILCRFYNDFTHKRFILHAKKINVYQKSLPKFSINLLLFLFFRIINFSIYTYVLIYSCLLYI